MAIFYSNQGQAGLNFSTKDVPKLKGVLKFEAADSDDGAQLVKALRTLEVPADLRVPPFSWPTEPTLHTVDTEPEPPLVVVPHIDPAERVRDALRRGPMTVKEIQAAIRATTPQKVYRLLMSMPDVEHDGKKYDRTYRLLEAAK